MLSLELESMRAGGHPRSLPLWPGWSRGLQGPGVWL